MHAKVAHEMLSKDERCKASESSSHLGNAGKVRLIRSVLSIACVIQANPEGTT